MRYCISVKGARKAFDSESGFKRPSLIPDTFVGGRRVSTVSDGINGLV